MAFHHRKLLNDSLLQEALCNKFSCDNSTNPAGKCTATCWDICADGFCKELIVVPLPPPPLPPPPPPPLIAPTDAGNKSSPTLSLALTASLAVLATAFFLFTCYTIYKFYTVWSSSRRRSPPPQPEEDDDDYGFFDEENHGPVVDHPIWYIRTIGLQPSVINAIAIVSYKRADGLVDGTDCAVCLSEFEEDETLRLLPKCSHAFHIPCIDTWLRSHTNCPLCRAGVVSSAATPPPPAHDSGRVEDTRLEVAASEREVEEEARSQRVIEIDEQIEGDDGKAGIQGVRRSVSMDSVSASMITAAVASAFPQQFGKNSDNDLVKEKEIVSRVGMNLSSSMNQMGSSSIKRSASCSAKVFLSRHSSSSRSRS